MYLLRTYSSIHVVFILINANNLRQKTYRRIFIDAYRIKNIINKRNKFCGEISGKPDYSTPYNYACAFCNCVIHAIEVTQTTNCIFRPIKLKINV